MEESVSNIIDGLWIGGESSALSRQFFEKENIRCVINCTPNTLHCFASHGVEYLRIPVNDTSDKEDLELMDELIELAVEWLRVHHKVLKLNCLVHCHQGIQRSATVVCCYLMRHWNMSYKDAVEFMILRRQSCFYHADRATFKKLLESFK
jgi:protein-tyrosine phosphatase